MKPRFYSHYLDYAELTAQLQSWQKKHPEWVTLESIGKSPEGRDLWLLTLCKPKAGQKPGTGPAVWVDANMHATEFSGTQVTLAIIDQVLNAWSGKNPLELPEPTRKALEHATFYFLPRVSPDGAETVLKSGRYVRSSPSSGIAPRPNPYWEYADIDGDGAIRYMRVPCENGEMIASNKHPGLLLPRMPDSPPPYYRVYPEGHIRNYDGKTIPDPFYLSDNPYDFNRGFPWTWVPDFKQPGAGEYPSASPEVRAILEFTSKRPNIQVWLNLHTFGGVFIRPLGAERDAKMEPTDLAMYRQVAAWAEQFTSYPTVSAFEEFCYSPEKPLHGDEIDYAYHQRGALAYVIEIWDIFKRAGISPKKPFVHHYSHLTNEEFEKIADWDAKHNQGRCFQPWKPFQHPQLGPVELGGLDTRVGLSNPPEHFLEEVCLSHAQAFLRVAALVPQIEMKVERISPQDADPVFKIHVVNRGYLGSYGIESARALPVSDPIRLKISCDGCALIAPLEHTVELGHMHGWGAGLFEGFSGIFPTTRGNGHERTLHIAVKGRGKLRLEVGSERTGRISQEIQVS